MSYGMEYLFGHSGWAVTAASLSNSLCTPSLLAGDVVQGAEKALAPWKHCSAVTETFLYYQYKSRALPHTTYYEENQL